MDSTLRLKISLILHNLGDAIQQNQMRVTRREMLNLMFCINQAVCAYKWFCVAPMCELLTFLLPACSLQRQCCQMQLNLAIFIDPVL